MSDILLTGAAGFIGFHTARALDAQGYKVIGIDNLNDYYDPGLKAGRLEALKKLKHFTFEKGDIADEDFLKDLTSRYPDISIIIHLAAQAGVRYSLDNPRAYEHSNLSGQMCVLELARHLKGEGKLSHFVYASSSSVYGANRKLPFSETDRVDQPVSLYAATKKSGEMLAHSYAHLYDIPSSGLRFFTVYGTWGRPDMAYYSFTRALYEGETIKIFNNGDMGRDFTYVDDIVSGIITCMNTPPEKGDQGTLGPAPHRIFNLGNNTPERLLDFVHILEDLTGHTARTELLPMQPGDVKETFADIDLAKNVLGYAPSTSLREGLSHFVRWYIDYHGLDKSQKTGAA